MLNVDLSGGATVSVGANNSADMTLQGTVTEINAALATLTYTGNTDVVGTNADTLTVTTNDGGNTGSGGAQIDSDTVYIAVGASAYIDLDNDDSSGADGEDYITHFTAGMGPIAVVDVGAGDGVYSRQLNEEGAKVTAIEIDPRSAEAVPSTKGVL